MLEKGKIYLVKEMWWNHFILFKSVSFIINFNLYICQKHCVYNENLIYTYLILTFYVNSICLTPNKRFFFFWVSLNIRSRHVGMTLRECVWDAVVGWGIADHGH